MCPDSAPPQEGPRQVEYATVPVAVARAVQRVVARKDEWPLLPIPQKVSLLRQIRRRLRAQAWQWVDTTEEARAIPAGSPWSGEEWYEPYTVGSVLSLYIETLEKVARGQMPVPPRVWNRVDGRTVARVFPANQFEWLLFSGLSVEVWMQAGVAAPELSAKTVAALREPPRPGKVSLVLGAGNVNSIPLLDALHRLFVSNQVAVLKMNPVNDYMQPVFEQVLAPLIDRDYLAVVSGGAEAGTFLANHDDVDAIHITGSRATYQSIVRSLAAADGGGPGKRVTGELGGVTPAIVVPGKWEEADLRYQAEQVVTTKLYNNGFNCIGTQVLIVHERWPQRERFLELVRELMDGLPPYPATYPGAGERHRRALETYPSAERLGNDPLRLLIADLDPDSSPGLYRCEEFFGPILAEVALPGATTTGFLSDAVAFANGKLAGTLGANLIVHPRTAEGLGLALEEAVDALRYGSIGVNAWCGLPFRMPEAPWGAFHDDDGRGSESGEGTVHNGFLLDRPQKAVVRGSFYPFPRTWRHGDPAFLPRLPWLLTNRRRRQTAERVARFALRPGYRHLPGIFLSALRG